MTHCSPLHKLSLEVKNISVGIGIGSTVFTWYWIDATICIIPQHFFPSPSIQCINQTILQYFTIRAPAVWKNAIFKNIVLFLLTDISHKAGLEALTEAYALQAI